VIHRCPDCDVERQVSSATASPQAAAHELARRLDNAEQALRAIDTLLAAWEGRGPLVLDNQAIRQWRSLTTPHDWRCTIDESAGLADEPPPVPDTARFPDTAPHEHDRRL
jgi:hypothetical protein